MSKTEKWMTRRDAIIAQALTVHFQVFALLWVEFLTSYKAIDGYTVEKRGEQWVLKFCGADDIIGNASTVYGWIERSPLRRVAIEADGIRWDEYKKTQAA